MHSESQFLLIDPSEHKATKRIFQVDNKTFRRTQQSKKIPAPWFRRFVSPIIARRSVILVQHVLVAIPTSIVYKSKDVEILVYCWFIHFVKHTSTLSKAAVNS